MFFVPLIAINAAVVPKFEAWSNWGFRCTCHRDCARATDHLSFLFFFSVIFFSLFLIVRCSTSTHTYTHKTVNKTDLACTVLQNVVNIAACTHKFPIAYIHTRCTLYYCHCKLRSCHIDRETWCRAFFFSSSATFFSSFCTLWKKKISVLPDQNCAVATLQNVHASHVGVKKKKYKVYCLFGFSLCWYKDKDGELWK